MSEYDTRCKDCGKAGASLVSVDFSEDGQTAPYCSFLDRLCDECIRQYEVAIKKQEEYNSKRSAYTEPRVKELEENLKRQSFYDSDLDRNWKATW